MKILISGRKGADSGYTRYTLRFSDIHDLVHDLVTDKWMETIRSNEIDRYPEPFRDQVSQVDERHHTDWLVKFDNEIEIAAGGLGLPCIRSKDTDTPHMKPFPEFRSHAPQLVQYLGSVLHDLFRELLAVHIFE